MAGKANGKLRLLYVLDILKRYSDEEHPLDSSDIIDELSKLSIEANRKTIYDDIAALEDYGIDIIKAGTPKKGWFIGEREFEVPEIYLLCDAVRFAKFISPKKTRELLNKLNSLGSVHTAQNRKNAVFFRVDDKCSNEEIYYTVDKISRAVKSGKQLELEYCNRQLGNDRKVERRFKKMIINPYALVLQRNIGTYRNKVFTKSVFELIKTLLPSCNAIDYIAAAAQKLCHFAAYSRTCTGY